MASSAAPSRTRRDGLQKRLQCFGRAIVSGIQDSFCRWYYFAGLPGLGSERVLAWQATRKSGHKLRISQVREAGRSAL